MTMPDFLKTDYFDLWFIFKIYNCPFLAYKKHWRNYQNLTEFDQINVTMVCNIKYLILSRVSFTNFLFQYFLS